jgi:hypothetical protein
LLDDLGHAQAFLACEQGKDLSLSFGGGDKFAHIQSKSLTNNHSTFQTNFKREFYELDVLPIENKKAAFAAQLETLP